MRRERDEWVEADERHEALIPDEQSERAQAEMERRSVGQGGNRRRRPQKRPYLLRGIVHCATGHNPLRMQGRSRKGEPTYYTCGFRASYGDRAAEAVGHGKWQYVREDSLTTLIDGFFATRIFGGADRLAHFRRQSASLTGELRNRDGDKRKRLAGQIAAVEQKIERQLAAIEAGVDPVEVGRRIRELKAERAEAQAVLAQIEDSQRDSTAVDPDDARVVLDALPDLGKRLATADPDVRRAVFDAFRLHVEIDRNAGQVRLKALVSSAFGEARNLSDLGEAGDLALSNKAIRLIGALSKSETPARLVRLDTLRRKLLRKAADAPATPASTPHRIGEIPKAISAVLADATEPLHVAAIHRAVECLLERPTNYRSVKSCLSDGAIRSNPRFRRVAYGYYALAKRETA